MSSEEKQKLLENDDQSYGSSGKKNDKEKKEKAPKVETASIRDLYRYADWRDYLLLTTGILVSLVTGAGWPAMSMIFGGLSNTFISAQSTADSGNFDQTDLTAMQNISPDAVEQITKDMFGSQVSKYCIQYTILGFAMLTAGYIQMVCWITVCERQIHRIRRQFFCSILRQDIAWFDKNASGTLTTKLSDNLERVKEGIGDKFGLLIQYTAQCIAGVVIAMVYSWKATLIMMSFSPLLVIASAFMARLVSQSVKKGTEKHAIAGGIAEEVFSCIRTVVAFNGQEQECDRYEDALAKGKKDGILKNVWTGCGMGATMLIIFSSYALAFWYGSVLINENKLNPGDVFVVFFSVMMGSMALGSAGPQLATVFTAKGAGKAILDIIDRKPEIDSYNPSGQRLLDPKGRITFSDVCFNYPSRAEVQVLKNISFTVEPGQTVALVGPSGCGKSTIVQLLLRFYDPNSGKVNIDGSDLPDLNINWLRNLIGVVSQEPVLFECSVEENIRFGKENISSQEMIRACKMANAHDFISKLPDGYKTLVGERGTAMSGGQKQRIAIARALVRDPKILLLDEATSALDAESEYIVQEALDKAQEGRTTIVVAHRLSTIRNADKIIAIDAGEIKEIGTHSELINKKGLYYDLVSTQVFHQESGEDKSESEAEESGKPALARRLIILIGRRPLCGLAASSALPLYTGHGADPL